MAKGEKPSKFAIILKLKKIIILTIDRHKISLITLVMSLAPCSYPLFLDGFKAMIASA